MHQTGSLPSSQYSLGFHGTVPSYAKFRCLFSETERRIFISVVKQNLGVSQM